jgi:hypothetical protein
MPVLRLDRGPLAMGQTFSGVAAEGRR